MDLDEIIKKLGWRHGQFIFNFLAWLKTRGYATELGQNSKPLFSSMADPFYISDEDLDELGEEYLHELQTTTESTSRKA